MLKKEKNVVQVIPETTDDLYVLYKVLKGAKIEAKTDRKIKIKNTDKPARISLFVRIEVETLNYNPDLESLKANGKILYSKPEEYAPIGSYQSIDIEIGKKYKIEFESISDSLMEMLTQEKTPKTLIVLLDDEKAELAWLSNLEIKKIAEIKSGKSGKLFIDDAEDKNYEKYFKEIEKVLKEKNPEYLIIAGPGFTKTKFSKYLGNRFSFEEIGTSHTEKAGFKELLRSNLKKTLKSLQIMRDVSLLEKFYKLLSVSPEKVVYGLEDVGKAIELNACSLVLVSEDFFEEIKNKLNGKKIDVKIISSKHDAGKEFRNFQAAAFLHYPIF